MSTRLLALLALAVVAGAMAGSAATFALIQRSFSVPTSGSVTAVNVGVYTDAFCTQDMTSISWGLVPPGGAVSRAAYVKNTGNAPVTLSMAVVNWNPSAANGPITVTWDKTGTVLAPGQSVNATITLSVSAGISGITDFSVSLVITGSG